MEATLKVVIANQQSEIPCFVQLGFFLRNKKSSINSQILLSKSWLWDILNNNCFWCLTSLHESYYNLCSYRNNYVVSPESFIFLDL